MVTITAALIIAALFVFIAIVCTWIITLQVCVHNADKASFKAFNEYVVDLDVIRAERDEKQATIDFLSNEIDNLTALGERIVSEKNELQHELRKVENERNQIMVDWQNSVQFWKQLHEEQSQYTDAWFQKCMAALRRP